MRSVVPMKTAKIGYLVISVLFCVLGIVLIAAPGTSVVWLGRLLGIGMIVFGAIKLVGYFSRDLFRLAFQYDLAFGILLIALGIVTLARPNGAMSFLCIAFGIPVLADGLFKIQIALDARRFGIEKWWIVMLLAALTCVIGLLLVIRPSEAAQALMVLMGISLLLDGIGDTIRVPLTADPVREVAAAREILAALDLNPTRRMTLVSCPTCGRTRIDLIPLLGAFEAALDREGLRDLPVKVAFMGCAVNGPGEARDADIGIAGGIGEALLFRHGEIVARYPEGEIVRALIEELKKMRDVHE